MAKYATCAMIEIAVNRGSSDRRNTPSFCPASITSQSRLNAPAAVLVIACFGVRRLMIDELANEQLRKVRMLGEQLRLSANERANAVGVGGRALDRISPPREQLAEDALQHRAIERFLAVVVVVEQCGVHGGLLADLFDGRRGESLPSEQALGGVENEVLSGGRVGHVELIKRSINNRKWQR